MAGVKLDRSKVLAKFVSLGDSPDQVAKTLKEQCITGSIGESESCPLANYFKREFPELDDHEVNFGPRIVLDGLSFERKYSEVSDDEIPLHIWSFIDRFDSGLYPDLDDGLGESLDDDDDFDDDFDDMDDDEEWDLNDAI